MLNIQHVLKKALDKVNVSMNDFMSSSSAIDDYTVKTLYKKRDVFVFSIYRYFELQAQYIIDESLYIYIHRHNKYDGTSQMTDFVLSTEEDCVIFAEYISKL